MALCPRVLLYLTEAVVLLTVATGLADEITESSIVTRYTLCCYLVNGHWCDDGDGDACKWSLAVMLIDFIFVSI